MTKACFTDIIEKNHLVILKPFTVQVDNVFLGGTYNQGRSSEIYCINLNQPWAENIRISVKTLCHSLYFSVTLIEKYFKISEDHFAGYHRW